MPTHLAQPDLQTEALRAYTALHTLRPDWPGALVLSLHLDLRGAALSLAANIAGAVCLTLEADPVRTRGALRTGACDFVVNTLDEALRAIKNEIRQHRPLSVALQAEPSATLDEILARGVAPQLFTAPTEYTSQAAALAAFGTQSIDLRPTPGTPATLLDPSHPQPPSPAVSTYTCTFLASTELRAFDLQALALLPPEDAFRRRWLIHAPRLFPRDRHRVLWLTPEEHTALALPEPVAQTAIEPRPSAATTDH